MKKIKALFRKISSKLTINMNKRPFLTTLGLLLFLDVAIIIIAAFIAMALDSKNYPNLYRALLYAVQWLIIPNSLLYIEETSVTVLAAVVYGIGLVLFTGTIIAMTTNYLRSYLAARGEAKGKLNLSNHYVILNYNQKVLSVLINLMFNGTDNTVLILSDRSKDFLKHALNAELAMVKDKPDSKLNLIVRKGNPFSARELDDICITGARGILIADSEQESFSKSEMSATDFDAMKLVLEMAEFNIPASCPIAVEAETFEVVKMIKDICRTVKGLSEKSVHAFSFNRKLGQFLAGAVLYPEITGVIYELLSFIGSEFYAAEGEAGVEEYLAGYTESIPIVRINKTYVLAENFRKVGQKRKSPFSTGKRLRLAAAKESAPINLFIIGANKKSEFILETLEAAADKRAITIRQYPAHDRARFIGDLFADSGEKLALILSDDAVAPAAYDTNVFLTLIELHNQFGGAPPFRVIAEILDAKNQNSVEKFSVQNIIVSNRIIAFFATQMITTAESGVFYEEIFSRHRTGDPFNFEIRVDKAGDIFENLGAHTFSSYAEFVHAAYYGSSRAVMPLGFLENGKNVFYCDGLDVPRNYKPANEDMLIYVRYLNGNCAGAVCQKD